MNNCELTGKTAFVTGSSRGIGRAAAEELAARGARVIFHASRPTELLKGRECFCGDLGDPAAVTGLTDEMEKRGVSPDILVLNASVQSYTGVDSFLPEEFDRMFQVNVKSAFLLLNRLAPMPVWYPEDAELFLKAGLLPDDTHIVVIANFGLDHQQEIPLCGAWMDASNCVQRMQGDGSWAPLPLRRQAERFILETSLLPLEVAILRISCGVS